MIASHRSEHHHNEQFNKMNPHERHELDDRLRPVASVRSNNNNNLTTRNTKEHTQTTANHQDRMETRLAGRWRRPQGRNRTPPPGHSAPARIHCSLPLVLLIILSSFKLDFNLQPTQQPSTSMLVQAQFLFTYEINQESDESRVPRSSLFDPSSFKIVTPSQLQSSYQKLASQLPEPVPAQSQPPSSSPSSAAAAAPVSPETNLAPEPNQQQAFQSLLEPPAVTTTPSTSAGSFLKQTSAAIQSFAELFHLTPSSSPTPLAGLQTPQTNSQPSQPLVATNGIDQQAEARSLHEHWTQQQKRAHNQAAGSTGQQPQQQQVSAFQSFTTSPSVLSGPSGVQTGTSHHHHHHHLQQQQPQPQQQQQSGSQASYWLTSNPLNAPDGNFLVEIKNAGESSSGNQEAEQAPARGQHQHQHQTSQNLPSNHHHHQPQQQQQQPPATTASSFTRPASAQSSFLSTPTNTYFGLPANTNQKPPNAASLSISAPIQHQTSPVAPTGLVTTHVDRFNQQNFRKPAHFQPQTQALHQHQARSLSHQQQQQARQLATTPTSHHQSELLDGGQLQPPANTPEHFSGGPPTNVAPPSLHGSIGGSSGRQLAPLKSAEESLIAFRQQQQHHHDQQGALLAAVQNQFAAQAGRHSSNGELPPSTGNSLLDDELATLNHHQPASNQHHHHHQHPLESSSGDQRPKLPVGGLTSNTYSSNTQQAAPRHQQQQQQQQAAAPPASVEIPKVSPQIYESFLLQQKDQYEKHMELLKQQQELNKLLEQKQKQQQQQQQQEAEKRKRKKEELERLEARKKANAAREQEQQLVAARKARQEAEEARRKQLRQLEEEETKRRRQAEEERRYRELMEAREREEAKRKLKEAEEAAELARRQREQQERDALAEQQKRRREQQEAAEEAAKQQQQYKTYLKQQEELRKLLELKQKEDEAAQARQRQAGQMSQQQQQQQGGRLTISRANKLALEHKERGRQIPQRTNSEASGSHAPSWGGRQTRVRAVTLGSHSSSANAPTELHQSGQSFVPNTSSTAATTTTTTSTTSTTPATPASSSAPRVGTRLSSRNGANGGLRRLKTDEKLIRQKIPNYSGAGKYGLYQSDSDELAKLLEAVTLPPASSSSSTTTTTTASSTTTTTTTQAPPPASSSSSSSSDLLDSDEPNPGRSLTSSSLSPLLNLRELGVTPPSVPQAQARPTTGEPFSSTTIFDDDVPRRPVRNPSAVAAPQQQHQGRRSFPAPILPAASVASATRTTLTNRMGTSGSSGSNANSTGSTTHRGASIGLASLPADSDNDGIPGRAGHEYPVLAEVPQTSFSCSRMKLSGFFADTETACQVVHLCQDGAQSSILCPNGTIFNQEKFSCQWWYEVNCARAPMFYQLNDNLYKSSLGSTSSTTGSSSSQDSGSVELNKRTRTSTGTSTVTSNNLKSS